MSALDSSINLLEELDNVSKIHLLEREDIDEMMIEFAKRITKTLHIERMSVWLFNTEKSAVISMGEYDQRNQSFQKENTLLKSDFPFFFNTLEENKILLAENIFSKRIKFYIAISFYRFKCLYL